MPFKYQEYLSNFHPNCPNANHFVERTVVGYRFLNSGVVNEQDFLPKAFSGEEIKELTCSHYAVSFFSSVEQIVTKLKSLNKKLDATKRHGSHCCEVNIITTDGVTSPPSNSGHFAVHEYIEVSFIERARNITNLTEQIQDRGGNAP